MRYYSCTLPVRVDGDGVVRIREKGIVRYGAEIAMGLALLTAAIGMGVITWNYDRKYFFSQFNLALLSIFAVPGILVAVRGVLRILSYRLLQIDTASKRFRFEERIWWERTVEEGPLSRLELVISPLHVRGVKGASWDGHALWVRGLPSFMAVASRRKIERVREEGRRIGGLTGLAVKETSEYFSVFV